MSDKRFYRCMDCLEEFSELNDDEKCEYCGSDNINLIRIVQSDNTPKTEISKPIKKV